ncbi:MAG: polyisoprenyl-teichoic acid--peptidoglycan teichoic acid transferase [Clostridia bacterium]|nr:polyisoprenyl-teichoic acid--peptidoglycan teichoic acid transferase [Clostridia bacterium]
MDYLEVLSLANHHDMQAEFWGEAVARRQPKRRLRLGRFLLVLALAFLVFSGFSYAGYRLAENWLGVLPGMPGGGGEAGQAGAAATQPESILLIGVDQRKDEPSRSDTIILAFIDPQGPRVNLLSIPRDTYVSIPGYGHDKINSAHTYGGPELLMETVSDFLGVNVQKYVEVNFEGFARIVDILGGVDIDVDKRMYYPEEGINLRPGLQHLNGHDALGYVRFRYDPEGDITRIGRQQKFLKALVDQTLSLRTVPKIPRLIGELSREVKTNLSTKEMLGLALALKDLSSNSIEAQTVPGEPFYLHGVSYWRADQEKLSLILEQFTARKPGAR